MDPNCYKASEIQLNKDLVKQLDSLPDVIEKPELGISWIQYKNFLKTYGTHIISKVHYGAKLTQWTFAKREYMCTDYQYYIRTCVNFEGITEVGKLGIKPCVGVSTEESEESLRLDMTSYLDLLGGMDQTRNALRHDRSKELITKFLADEGRNNRTPVDYKYTPIWKILMLNFYDNPKRHAIALNMLQYYKGFLDFGCSLIQVNEGSLHYTSLRSFVHSRFSTKEMPTYECLLEQEGCHSDADCHLGPFRVVTYCYGLSCVEYVSPSFGSKATDIKIREEQSRSTFEGINRSCHHVVPSSSGCDPDLFVDKVIWNGRHQIVDTFAAYNIG